MNARLYRDELLDILTPIYGVDETNAMFRVVMDYLERTENISTNPETIWPEPVFERASWILSKLQLNHPLQYVLQESWFDGNAFYVNESVLIPRPETEELLDWIKKDPGHNLPPEKILDIGTGSGILAISLKRAFPSASVTAIDISKAAIEVAQKNATRLQTSVEFIQMDFMQSNNQAALPTFDLIVSNPPYIALSEKESMAAHVLEHEPWEALFVPNEDPICFYRSIAIFGLNHLLPGGKIYVEVHEDRGELTRQVFESLGYTTQLRRDMQGKERMIQASKSN